MSTSAASCFSSSLIRPLMSSGPGLLVSAAKNTISPTGASPVATAPNLGPLFFLFLESLSTLWKVSFVFAALGVNNEAFPNACVPFWCSIGFSLSKTSPSPTFRFGGYSNRKDLRCSFLPLCCSAVEELIPAKAVAHCSVDCA